MIEDYVNQNLNDPKYLFHGSPFLLQKVDIKLSHDSNNNGINIDEAVFLTPSVKIASAYAFKDKIKMASEGLEWNFEIKSDENIPIMIMDNVRIDENLYGYIYIFINNDNFKNEPTGSLQYKSFESLVPIDIIKIYYKDFNKYYQLKNHCPSKTK